jgi:hypothetical protein
MNVPALLWFGGLLTAFSWALYRKARTRPIRFTLPDEPALELPEEQELRIDAVGLLREQAVKPRPLRNQYLINRALDEYNRQKQRENAQ